MDGGATLAAVESAAVAVAGLGGINASGAPNWRYSMAAAAGIVPRIRAVPILPGVFGWRPCASPSPSPAPAKSSNNASSISARAAGSPSSPSPSPPDLSKSRKRRRAARIFCAAESSRFNGRRPRNAGANMARVAPASAAAQTINRITARGRRGYRHRRHRGHRHRRHRGYRHRRRHPTTVALAPFAPR